MHVRLYYFTKIHSREPDATIFNATLKPCLFVSAVFLISLFSSVHVGYVQCCVSHLSIDGGDCFGVCFLLHFWWCRVMLVGWGGNNGSTLMAGVIANRE